MEILGIARTELNAAKCGGVITKDVGTCHFAIDLVLFVHSSILEPYNLRFYTTHSKVEGETAGKGRSESRCYTIAEVSAEDVVGWFLFFQASRRVVSS